jgi:oligosaccharide repeat unit polymerase
MFGAGGQNDIGFLTASICLAGVLATLLGCIFGRVVKIQQKRVSYDLKERRRIALPLLLLLATVGGALAMMKWQSLGFSLLNGLGKSLYAMNVAYSQDKEIIGGVAGRLYSLLPVLLMFAAYLRRHDIIARKKFILISLLSIMLMISPRRSMLITAGLVATIIGYQARKLSVFRLAAVGVVIGLVVFIFFGVTQFYLKKIDGLNFTDMLHSFSLYFNSSVYVMNQLVKTDHLSNTWIALNMPVRLVNDLFGTRFDIDLSVPFVSVPELSNTVPMYYYFYRSAGFLGVIVWSFLIGLISTIALRLYESRGSFLSASISALMMAGLLLSIRENIFFSYNFMYWILVAFLIDLLDSKRVALK